MGFLITAYYTSDSIYSEHADRLKRSLVDLKLQYHIRKIDTLGSWQKNTQYKPTFLLDMLIKFPGHNIVYVDIDAEFKQYPVLFDSLTDCKQIAAHQLNHRCHTKRERPNELLSGTLFLPNTSNVHTIIKQWIEQCKSNPTEWDQRVLEKVVGSDYYFLPEEYCFIFDYKYSREIKPIIVHYQASRAAKRKERTIKK